MNYELAYEVVKNESPKQTAERIVELYECIGEQKSINEIVNEFNNERWYNEAEKEVGESRFQECWDKLR